MTTSLGRAAQAPRGEGRRGAGDDRQMKSFVLGYLAGWLTYWVGVGLFRMQRPVRPGYRTRA